MGLYSFLEESSSGFIYVHYQGAAAFTWTIIHNLDGYPNVTTVDYSGQKIEGDVHYISANQIDVIFSVLVDGKAYLS